MRLQNLSTRLAEIKKYSEYNGNTVEWLVVFYTVAIALLFDS